MIASELINYLIPPLKLSDDGHKAVVWMEELRTNQLPVVDKSKFLGFLSEDIILEENDSTKRVENYDLFAQECFVFESQHFYDVIKVASEHDVQLVAVLNEKGNFELVYKTKKYGILCERKFEINSNFIIIGFVSNGCF